MRATHGSWEYEAECLRIRWLLFFPVIVSIRSLFEIQWHACDDRDRRPAVSGRSFATPASALGRPGPRLRWAYYWRSTNESRLRKQRKNIALWSSDLHPNESAISVGQT